MTRSPFQPLSLVRRAAIATAGVALGALVPSAPTAAGTQGSDAGAAAADTVVVMLVDGLAGHVVAEHPTPELDLLARTGASSQSLRPVTPSVSLPNGVSVSTGCWPGKHGIVGNRFVDPRRGAFDHSQDADWLMACEHLHQAVERQGGSAAVFGWYGVLSERRGPLATHVGRLQYDCAEPRDDERVEEAIGVLNGPRDDRPALLLVYLCGPDDALHFEGIDSTAALESLAAADRAIGRMRAAIEALPDGDRVALVVAADHGMTEITTLVNIERILRRLGIEGTVVGNSGMAYVYLDRPAPPDALRALAAYEEFTTYLRDSLPARMHLERNRRLGDLVLLTEPPYFFADVDRWPWYLRFASVIGPQFAEVGARVRAGHGYDPRRRDMQGVLYLWGAGVPAGVRLESPRAIDVHPTVLELLGLTPLDLIDGRSLLGDGASVEQP